MLTEAQKQKRAGKVTSSIVAAVLSQDSRCTQAMAKERILRRAPSVSNKAIDRGNKLESLILDYPAEELGLVRHEAPFVSKEDWAGDSADCLYMRGDELVAVGEGKSASQGIGYAYKDEGLVSEADQIPRTTFIQSHWHLIHWPKARCCLVPVLVGGYAFEFRMYRVNRDEEFESAIWKHAKEWHKRHIINDEEPPYEPKDVDLLAQWYPRGQEGVHLEYSAKAEDLAYQYEAARQKVKVASDELKMCKLELQRMLGERTHCIGSDARITWTNNKDSEKTDWYKLYTMVRDFVPTDNLERAMEACTTTKPGPRVMRVWVKGNR